MYVHAMFDCFTDFVLKLLEMKVLSGFARCLTWILSSFRWKMAQVLGTWELSGVEVEGKVRENVSEREKFSRNSPLGGKTPEHLWIYLRCVVVSSRACVTRSRKNVARSDSAGQCFGLSRVIFRLFCVESSALISIAPSLNGAACHSIHFSSAASHKTFPTIKGKIALENVHVPTALFISTERSSVGRLLCEKCNLRLA